jgi:hypothetical protein
MNKYQRMIKMPDGIFKEHEMLAIRLNPDNPREVTLILPNDTCELSREERDNHFHFIFFPTDFIDVVKQDSIE